MSCIRHITILCLLLLQGVIYAQQEGKGSTGLILDDQDQIQANRDDFIYDVELLPGQEFSGYIYHWSESGVAYGELHEEPGVNWLEVSPSSFISNGCEKPVPVKFTFKAPMEIGTYKTTVEDWEYNWADNVITLIVTKHPTYKMTDSVIFLEGPDTTLIRYQEHEYQGINPSDSWYDQGYCGEDPYVFNPLRKVVHMVYPPRQNVTIDPSSFNLQLNETRVVMKTFTPTENHLDSFYESVSSQWRSYPEFIKWKIIREDLCCPLPEPVLTLQTFPNPLRDAAVVTFTLPYDSRVTFKLFDLRGRLIKTIVDESLPADKYQFQIDGKLLAEGLYLGRLQTEKDKMVEKIVKVKD